MPVLRMTNSDFELAISVDQLIKELQAAKDAGVITGASKVVMSQMCGKNIFPIQAVVAPGKVQGDYDVVALSHNTEEELLATGLFEQHA